MELSSYVTINTLSPWNVMFPLNLPKGFEKTFCIICSQTVEFFTIDKIRVRVFPQPSVNYCEWKKVRYLPNG